MEAVSTSLSGRSYLRVADWSRPELETVLDLAAGLKEARSHGDDPPALRGKTIALLFLKASTRTRVSFAAGIAHLGGMPLFFSGDELQLSRGEPLRDTALVLSRYVDAIVIRTFAHGDVEELARHATIPVVNALTDTAHPLQTLADLLTMRERRGDLDGLKLTYVGDGNNVCASLLVGAATFGMHVVAATPADYAPSDSAVATARARAAESGGSVNVTNDVHAAVAGADFVYTDVWTSMGQEAENERRRRDFAGFTVDAALLEHARDAFVLHCLPAHYGEEITEDVAFGPQSIMLDQAENRLHTQKALLALVVK
jgi:ornithine carbamoyltransferase